MDVTVNGERLEMPAGSTIADLLARLAVRAEAVAVERNRALVRRRDHAATALSPGDVLEVVTFVGGG
jgi:sulfur carrier protein